MRREAGSNTSEVRVSQDGLKYFIGRDDFRDLFLRHLNLTDSNGSQVLVVHGVGGIGKTSLIRKLGQELDAAEAPYPKPALPHARFDFENLESSIQAYREVLVKLRHDLGSTFKIDFPKFDLCLAVMLAQEGGPAPKLVSVNPTLNRIYQFVLGLSPVPYTSTIVSAGSLIAEIGAKHIPAFGNWLRKAGGTEAVLTLRKRAHENDQYLPDKLIELFVADLKEELPKRSDKVHRGVLFLDSYEKLWSGREASRSAQARSLDEWVRKLAAFCLGSDVLLVIVGRDRLRWDEDNPDEWNGYLDQHLLGGLTAHDAQVFLFKCGIGHNVPAPPVALQSAIIQCCKESSEPGKPLTCHTFYLALCADIVLNDRANSRPDPTPETFRSIPSDSVAKELADRFLQSLHDRAKEIWLEKLSQTPRFNQSSALYLLGATSVTEAEAAWELLTSFSFLTPQSDGFWRLHDTMRTALRTRISQDRAQLTHEQLRDFWAEQDEMSLAFFHEWSLDPYGTTNTWTQRHETALTEHRIPDARELLILWADITLDDADRKLLGDQVWAATHGKLGNAFRATPIAPLAGALKAAIEHYEAALQVYTIDNYPQDWAGTQNNLGNAYNTLPTGDRGLNLQNAIRCYQEALKISTEDDFPQDWATIQNNLGNAYRNLPTGDRELNLQNALGHYQAALKVYSKNSFPQQWASIQNNLAVTYTSQLTGDRKNNIRKAIQCYHDALTIYTEAKHPLEWATIQNNLGNAYNNLLRGNQDVNSQDAIQYYQAALRVYTKVDFPQDWAMTQGNLGRAFTNLTIGDRETNLIKAVDSYKAALQVYTEVDFPQDWTTIQHSLGNAYCDLHTGNREQNIQNAINCYQGALRISTEQDFPQDWAESSYNLGRAFLMLAQETGNRSGPALASACFAAAERGFSLVGLSEAAADAGYQREKLEPIIQQMHDTMAQEDETAE